MKKRGIFVKIFAYTIVAMILMVIITAVLFSRQFFVLTRTIERVQTLDSYQPLVNRIKGSDYSDIPEVAQRFYGSNQSFEFSIIADDGGVIYATPAINNLIATPVAQNDGGVIYATPGADTSDDFVGDFYYVVYNDQVLDYSVIAQTRPGLAAFYNEIIARVLVVFSLILALCLVCTYVLARQITNPIKWLAVEAEKMSRLEDVPYSLPRRRDELGDLSRDIHAMYDKLKETIFQLESEILRVKEIEETQRYFFSAASHELKTPIAATSILLEGMLENVGDYKDHPKYLRECVKMTDTQSKVISEILEIVNLSDGKIAQVPEKLDIRHTVTEILPDFQILAESNDQRIVMDIPDGQTCLADPKMLKKALSNVILNAVQNTPSGGEIRIWSEPVAEQYHLCIRNTGTRIEDVVLPKLFDPFYRADKARSRKDGRSGLGLTIVQKTLEAMNVDFALENTPKGVLFWMNFPKVKQP